MGIEWLLRAVPARAVTQGPSKEPDRVGVVVLAAGQSLRMGARNKLLCEVEGEIMVARVVDQLLQTSARPIVVVTGHEAEELQAALTGRDLRFAHNDRYADGMSTSLRVGITEMERAGVQASKTSQRASKTSQRVVSQTGHAASSGW